VTDEFSEGQTLHAVAQDDYIYMRGRFEFSDIVNVYVASLSDRAHYAPHTPINSGEAGPITAATDLQPTEWPIWPRSSGMVKSEKFTMLIGLGTVHVFIRIAPMERLWSDEGVVWSHFSVQRSPPPFSALGSPLETLEP
jgi:hypothetical protein